MIRYALKCAANHRFESWFQNADAFDVLHAKRMITCPDCGIDEVAKAVMTPRLNARKPDADTAHTPPDHTPPNHAQTAQVKQPENPDTGGDMRNNLVQSEDVQDHSAPGAHSPSTNTTDTTEVGTDSDLKKLRQEVEANSEYVGMQFAQEARAMHEGEIENRPIYGEAKPDEAVKLIKDGVKVAPLPFIPTRKIN